jgi:aryl-alcohol dehydrogenase-like predicted oxidoreductase
VLLAALDAGVTLFDTAALYGFGANEDAGGPGAQAAPQRIVLCQQGRHGRRGIPDGSSA